MKIGRARFADVVTLSPIALATLAAPAGAVTRCSPTSSSSGSTGSASCWSLSLLGLIVIAHRVGYYVKVLRPKYRGRSSRDRERRPR